MSTEVVEDAPRQVFPTPQDGMQQEEVLESEDDSLPIIIGKTKNQRLDRVNDEKKAKTVRSNQPDGEGMDSCDSPQRPTRREDATESTAERTSLLDPEGDHGGDGPLIGEEIEVRNSQRKRTHRKKKEKRKKEERRKEESGEAQAEEAGDVQNRRKKKKTKKKKKEKKNKDESDAPSTKSKKPREHPPSSASEQSAEAKLTSAKRPDRNSSSGRKRQDPEGDRSSVASSSSVSSSYASHVIDASLSSICDDDDGNDSDDDNEDSCAISLFLSPSNEFDSSSDDCFEPSPEWLESIRLKQQSYYYQRSSDALSLAAPGGANSQSITARNLDSEFVAGSQPEHSWRQLQKPESRLDRPSFQCPMNDLTPNSFLAPSYPRPAVAVVDENAGAAQSSSGRFDPKDLPVICIPRGDGVEVSQRDYLQKSWNAKQQSRQKKQKRRCWIIAGFLTFNVLLAVGVAIPFVLPLTQNKNYDNSKDGLSTNSTSSLTPSSPQQVKCFETSTELESAVDEYLSQPEPISANASIVQTYGYMRDWCVDSITWMDSLFSADRNPLVIAFNEPIGSWKVGSVTSMKAMFRSASRFNQDLSSWNVRRLQDMTDMFRDAREFRQNLCAWRSILPTYANTTNAFINTNCDDAAAGSDSTSTSVFLCFECLTPY